MVKTQNNASQSIKYRSPLGNLGRRLNGDVRILTESLQIAVSACMLSEERP